ncbi:Licodione synthase [Hypsizygus marmoreus]|uniref:Licodione synthase n=1 Tax=Hypsizygus marmoreus TaxID=39966 RepID=A0A369JYD2_HYPMA|nr:Licodione synthase [Hypsizygus marmoreus]
MSPDSTMISFSASISILSGLAAIIFAYFLSPSLLRIFTTDKDGNILPPGPAMRYALLGKYPERALNTWAHRFGPLFSIWMGSQLFVVVSDPHIARELLVTNGAIFSTRKKIRIILRGRAITASEYGDNIVNCNPATYPKGDPRICCHNGLRSPYLYPLNLRRDPAGKLPINPAHFAGRFALKSDFLELCDGWTNNVDGSTTNPLIEHALDLAMEFMDLTEMTFDFEGPWSNAIDFLEPLQWIPTRTRARGHKLHDGLIEVYGNMIDESKLAWIQERMSPIA